jgi:hypothetical protein
MISVAAVPVPSAWFQAGFINEPEWYKRLPPREIFHIPHPLFQSTAPVVALVYDPVSVSRV